MIKAHDYLLYFPVGFSGCHRYEAHQRLGLPKIRCKVRRGTKETLRFILPSDRLILDLISVEKHF